MNFKLKLKTKKPQKKIELQKLAFGESEPITQTAELTPEQLAEQQKKDQEEHRRQTRIAIQKQAETLQRKAPVEEFDYDAGYDDAQKQEAIRKLKEKASSKHIEGMLKAKEEKERMRVVKEGLFNKKLALEAQKDASGEVFVTSSYKKKKEQMDKAVEDERKAQEEKEKKEKEKNSGMRGIYMRFLNENEPEEDTEERTPVEKQEEIKTSSKSEESNANYKSAETPKKPAKRSIYEQDLEDESYGLSGGLNVQKDDKTLERIIYENFVKSDVTEDIIKQYKTEYLARRQRV